MNEVGVVLQPSEGCKTGGCQMSIAKHLLRQAKQLQEQSSTAIERARMGVALWCDEGNHAFSEKADSMTGTRKTTKDGVISVEDYLICGDCMVRKTNVPAIENVPVESDTASKRDVIPGDQW